MILARGISHSTDQGHSPSAPSSATDTDWLANGRETSVALTGAPGWSETT